MNHLRVGIAGYGTVGKIRHECITASQYARVVAVSDQNLIRNPADERSVEYFQDYQSMLESAEIDLLFIALPNFLAAEATMSALHMGLHVFCEKPPARNVAELKNVLSVEAAHPELKLMYGFNHRYHPSVKQALEIVQSGELGEVLDLRGVYGKSAIIRYDSSDWRSQRRYAGGGILLDQGIHMVDMMRLLGGDFKDVHSFVSNRHWKHDVEDNAYALMRTSDGVVAMLHSSATQWRHRFQLDVTLTGGAISLSGILSSTRSYGAETISVAVPSSRQFGDPMETTTRFNEDTSWQEEVDEFLTSVLAGPALTSSLDALKTMELVYAIYEADSTWRHTYGADWDVVGRGPDAQGVQRLE